MCKYFLCRRQRRGLTRSYQLLINQVLISRHQFHFRSFIFVTNHSPAWSAERDLTVRSGRVCFEQQGAPCSNHSTRFKNFFQTDFKSENLNHCWSLTFEESWLDKNFIFDIFDMRHRVDEDVYFIKRLKGHFTQTWSFCIMNFNILPKGKKNLLFSAVSSSSV